MSKKLLVYKAIIWQIIGAVWITLFSYLWFGSWNKSFLFSFIVMIVSILIYIIFELIWAKLIVNIKK